MKMMKLAVSISACLVAGAIGSVFTSMSVGGWYKELAKPSFNPPSWVFAPVWTLLYIMMGISLFLAASSQNVLKDRKKIPLFFFALQLILNIAWSALFFGLQDLFLAFCEIILLWISIVITIVLFKKLSSLAAYLLLPYLLWVTFAAFLNYSIFVLNYAPAIAITGIMP
ncbi:MAG TPA: tryptophan-rich sensory protein [bacterium]|nr:tryptophan-rich sensory protein [bacterium]